MTIPLAIPCRPLWFPDRMLPRHTNGMLFEACDESGQVVLSRCVYSVGGGALLSGLVTGDGWAWPDSVIRTFAADIIALAVAEIGAIAQRRVALLVDPALSHGLPGFLTPKPGLNSGMMIAEVKPTASRALTTATMMAILRRRC